MYMYNAEVSLGGANFRINNLHTFLKLHAATLLQINFLSVPYNCLPPPLRFL